ncbi:MAG: type II toxin-antitoxin system VapB family antitoxin [Gallionellaceae bacterium]|nr:type II toxin-antitoxin system VapB family antitoxin [Gallionellaceae bacterium]
MKTAKLFQNGQSQAVRLPKEFRFEGEEVFIKKTGNVVMLIPVAHSWDSLMGSLDKFSPDFMDERNQPQQQTREEVFP